jgi:hypothetical protein
VVRAATNGEDNRIPRCLDIADEASSEPVPKPRSRTVIIDKEVNWSLATSPGELYDQQV